MANYVYSVELDIPQHHQNIVQSLSCEIVHEPVGERDSSVNGEYRVIITSGDDSYHSGFASENFESQVEAEAFAKGGFIATADRYVSFDDLVEASIKDLKKTAKSA